MNAKRGIYDQEFHAHFVTFSCYRRRRLLDSDQAKLVVVNILADQLKKQDGKCLGFVVMPDHVHAMVWFPRADELSSFMKNWKQRSSFHIKRLLQRMVPRYFATFSARDPIWQPRYYDFNVYSEKKMLEKLGYMHSNPVRAGLAASACEWLYGSARHYENGESLGIPMYYER